MSTKIPPDCAENVTKKPSQPSAATSPDVSLGHILLTRGILLVDTVSFHGVDLAQRAVVGELFGSTVRFVVYKVSVRSRRRRRGCVGCLHRREKGTRNFRSGLDAAFSITC